MPEERIVGEGTIIAVLDRQAYRVELANGHVCTARALRSSGIPADTLVVGDRVRLSFSPADLSRARLVERTS